jgi:hypothetical protein
VRGESIWTERERAQSCSLIMVDGGSARAGTREEEGSSSSAVDAEWSEATASSPNRRVRGERREGNGGWSARCHVEEGKREREGTSGAAQQGGPQGWNGSGRHDQRRQCMLVAEAGWRTEEGSGARPTWCGRD